MSATLRGLGLCIDDLGNTFASTALPVAPGTVVDDDSGHEYMFVYNTGTVAITQYYGAFHSNTSTLAYVVAVTGLGTGQAYAGVAMTDIDSSNGGWICIKGLCTAYASAAVATVGWAVRGGASGVHACTQYQDAHIGYAVVTNTAAGTLLVKLNI